MERVWDTRRARKELLRNDILKFVFLSAALAMGPLLLVIMPSLVVPSLLGISLALLFSPVVASLERRGISRDGAIGIVFGVGTLLIGLLAFWAGHTAVSRWEQITKEAPNYLSQGVTRMTELEGGLKAKYSFMQNMELVASLSKWADGARAWFVQHGAGFAGELLQTLILAPFFAFVMLSSGPMLFRRFLSLVPNRAFESSFIVTTRILGAFSDYLRAKLLEAILVGLICLVGFVIVGAPYPVALALFAGLTNILPYIGPFIGAVPCLLVTGLDPANAALLWPTMIVYGISQVVDTFVIFPVMVAGLVNLHPLFVILAVMIGGEYYGLIGMLISVPLMTAFKITVQEIHAVLYRKPADQV